MDVRALGVDHLLRDCREGSGLDGDAVKGITVTRGDCKARIDAHVFGDWAAHRLIDADPVTAEDYGLDTSSWRVSHVPTGFCIGSQIDDVTEREAICIAQALGKMMPSLPPMEGNTSLSKDPWLYLVQQIIGEALHDMVSP